MAYREWEERWEAQKRMDKLRERARKMRERVAKKKEERLAQTEAARY